ncbi:hypothetical protein FO440_01790 [Mucilaginibacter corticis]|uniref:DUF2281 domain-containing protein n=1 Tax=Mucilaginibacter corticis TaxID=2597670 RepID=A0A556MST9_9SPHI|nr:hypothetical protein [Mucilaginibacter corticis]TSJ42947.1 hypothetical protein FO440_01790 [Mucilaginibacter corticis]
MTKQAIIEHTIEVINQLPEDKAVEIADFADFLIRQQDELSFNKDVQGLASGQSFDFLKEEEDLYAVSDLKEVYGKR